MRTPPKKILLWGLLVRLISGYQPSLYSFQRSLPRLPVPKLSDTIEKLLESLKPIKSAEELAVIRKQAQDFERGIGPRLQKLLYLKSWITPNYVSDWWYVFHEMNSIDDNFFKRISLNYNFVFQTNFFPLFCFFFNSKGKVCVFAQSLAITNQLQLLHFGSFVLEGEL